MTGFIVPAGLGESELNEKRSRFLGHIRPVSSEEEARTFILEIKKQYHDARHNCWCYRLYGGPERFSDDGEPQGSAGMPMLEVFRREEIYNFACVVTRYFGGVLLGTGGLSRAYSAAAKEALLAAGTCRSSKWAELIFHCPYSMFDRISRELEAFGAVIGCPDYGTEVTLRIQIPFESAMPAANRIREMSSGRITPEISGPFQRIL